MDIEFIEEEIAEYYKDKPLSEETEETADEEFAFVEESNKQAKSHSSLLFYSALTLISALVLCAAFSLGSSIFSTKEGVERNLNILHKTDEEYIDAVMENAELLGDDSKISGNINRSERERRIRNFETVYPQLTEKLEGLKVSWKEKNDTLYDERQSLNALKQTISQNSVVLYSGYYTVGTNIPAGKYDVTGTGSIAVTSTSNEMVINEMLTSYEAKELILRQGYTVKLNGKASFVMKESAAEEEQ